MVSTKRLRNRQSCRASIVAAQTRRAARRRSDQVVGKRLRQDAASLTVVESSRPNSFVVRSRCADSVSARVVEESRQCRCELEETRASGNCASSSSLHAACQYQRVVPQQAAVDTRKPHRSQGAGVSCICKGGARESKAYRVTRALGYADRMRLSPLPFAHSVRARKIVYRHT